MVHAIDHTGQAVGRDRDRAGEDQVAQLKERTEILQIAEHYKRQGRRLRRRVADPARSYGETEKLDSFIALLQPFGIIELVRSGKILMARGPQTT